MFFLDILNDYFFVGDHSTSVEFVIVATLPFWACQCLRPTRLVSWFCMKHSSFGLINVVKILRSRFCIEDEWFLTFIKKNRENDEADWITRSSSGHDSYTTWTFKKCLHFYKSILSLLYIYILYGKFWKTPLSQKRSFCPI